MPVQSMPYSKSICTVSELIELLRVCARMELKNENKVLAKINLDDCLLKPTKRRIVQKIAKLFCC